MRPLETFFALNPIFTVEEAKDYLAAHKPEIWRKGCAVLMEGQEIALRRKPSIAKLLYYHHKNGRILLIRRGLYYVVPPGASIVDCPVDPYLLASKMAKDAVLAYHTALELHGYGHTVRYLFHYFTKNRAKAPFTFQNHIYQAVFIPSALIKAQKTDFGVMTIERSGVKIAITTTERTFVDILNRPNLSGSWEEIWKSFQGMEYLDLDQVIEYALLLSNRLTVAKVGYFLETHRDQFRVSDAYLEKLRYHGLLKARYLERSPKGPQKLISAWNLIIPQGLHEQNWEEPHGDF